MHTDDFLQRMSLSREDGPLNSEQLSRALLRLDESLNEEKAVLVAEELLLGRACIPVGELAEVFGTVEEKDKEHEASWLGNTLSRLRVLLVQGGRLKALREAFEFFDEHQEGQLDTANFKTVIM